MTLVILGIILFLLFGISFLSKRRFGTLGLGLAAGALLAQQLSRDVAVWLQQYDISIFDYTSVTLAAIILTLLPALVLLVSGPTYNSKKSAFVGSLAFGLMATMLLIGPISSGYPVTDLNTVSVFDFIASYENLLIASGVVLAVVDSWLTHNFKSVGKKSKH
jgi:hypothetical protein